jgi:hypothetical protein
VRVDLVALRGVDGVPDDQVRSAARRAMWSWNQAVGRELLTEGEGRAGVFIGDCGSDNSGTSNIRVANGVPLKASVCLNDPLVTFSADGRRGTYDLETILLHAFGHALGLGHPVRFGEELALLCGLGQADRVMCPRSEEVVTRTPQPANAPDPPTVGKIERRDRLGGLIHEYHRAAA